MRTIQKWAGAFVAAALLLLAPFAQAQQAVHDIGTPQDFYGDTFDTSIAGAPFNTANLGTQVLSENFTNCAHIGAAFTPPSAGQTFFADTNTNMSPSQLSCSSSGLSILLSYVSGVWTGGQVHTAPYYNALPGSLYQAAGYVEVAATFPPPPSGLLPWASIWFVSSTTQPSPVHTKEFDLFESGLNGSTNSATQVTTIHSWPAPQTQTSVAGVGHMYQQWVLPFNIFDGVQHKYGLLTTTPVGGKAWHVVYIDRTAVVRFRLNSTDMLTPMQLLMDVVLNYPITSPATTASTYTATFNSASAWSCPAAGCS